VGENEIGAAGHSYNKPGDHKKKKEEKGHLQEIRPQIYNICALNTLHKQLTQQQLFTHRRPIQTASIALIAAIS